MTSLVDEDVREVAGLQRQLVQLAGRRAGGDDEATSRHQLDVVGRVAVRQHALRDVLKQTLSLLHPTMVYHHRKVRDKKVNRRG